MSATTIWIVSSGEYSDYQVHCAFVSEDLAREYAAHRAGLTSSEYDELVAFWNRDDLWGEKYHAAFKSLPEKIREASYGEWRVQSRDLFDSLPVTAEEQVGT